MRNQQNDRMKTAGAWTFSLTLAALVGCASIPALSPGEVVVLDGQSCTPGGTGAANIQYEGTQCSGAEDWTTSLALIDSAYVSVSLMQRTRMAHRRPSPPGPPNDSLFIVFEASGAEPINNETMVSFGLSRTATATDARAYLIRPAATPVTGSGVGQTPATVRSYRWNGSSWVRDPSPVGVTASFAYNASLQYWGVEARVHLPTAGVTGDTVRVATHWKTRNPGVAGPAVGWRPSAAEATSGNLDLPAPNPGSWMRYRLANP